MADKKKDQTNAAEPAEERVSQDIGSPRTAGTSKTPAQSQSQSGGYVAADPQGKDNYHAKNTADDGRGMSASDLAALEAAGAAYNNATTDAEREAAHIQAEAIRNKYGYSGGTDGSQYIETGSGQQRPQIQQPTVQTPDFTGLLDSWLATAKQQQELGIDYATNKGVADLERAEEDAQEQFQTQQDQIDENEAKALDNQALYAEARGDRGGIGHAQYGQIQATAMTNRRAVNSARTKLATDTARQIADLRAQGEFQKADALLQLTQTYLGQLIDLQQWGAEYALNVAQFNAQLDQWAAEFELAVSDVTGTYMGAPTMASQQMNQNLLANSGLAALAVGVRPSPEQQAAMGYTDAQIEAELAAYKMAQSAGVKYVGSGGGGGGGDPVGGDPESDGPDYDGLFAAASKTPSPSNYIATHYEEYGFTKSTGLSDSYKDWAEENQYTEDDIGNVARGLLTDLRKYYASQQDMEAKAYAEYESGGITWKEYRWLSDRLGFGG